MGLFNKKVVDVEMIKKFLEQNGINWSGGVINIYSRDKKYLANVDNNTFNKLIRKPIRLIISSDIYKDVEIVTAGISKDALCLFNIDNNFSTLNLSEKWKEFQKSMETQNLDQGEKSL